MLQTQNLPLPLDLGINNKQDPKLVAANYGLDVENADYSTVGTLKKRNGREMLLDSTLSTGEVSQSIYANDKSILVMGPRGSASALNAVAYSGGITREISGVLPVNTSTKRVRYNYSRFPDIAFDTDRNLMLVSSNESGVSGLDIIDPATGSKISHSTTVFGGALRTRVFYNHVTESAVIVTQGQPTPSDREIAITPIDYQTGPGSSVIVTPACYSRDNFDALIDGDNLVVFYFSSSTVLTKKVYSLSSLALLSTSTVTPTHATTSNRMLCVLNWFFGYLVSYVNTNTGTERAAFLSLTTAHAEVNSVTIAAPPGSTAIFSVGSCRTDVPTSTSGPMHFLTLVSGPSATDGVHYSTRTTGILGNALTGVITTSGSGISGVMDGVAVTSRPLGRFFCGSIYSQNPNANIFYNSQFLFGLKESANDPTQVTPRIYSRFAELQAPPSSGLVSVSSLLHDSQGAMFTAIPKAPNTGGLQIANTGVDMVRFGFNDGPETYNQVSISGSIIASGGFALEYDGSGIFENGFHYSPQVNSISTSTTGGSIAAGTYSYRVVFVYTDANGQTSYSVPSGIDFRGSGTSKTRITTTGSTSSNTIQFNGYAYSQRQAGLVEIYRTAANGSIHYYVTSVQATTFEGASYVDTVADSSITSNRRLYTEGGVVPKDPIPGFKFATALQNRGVFAGGADDNAVFFTNKFLFGEAPSTSLEFELRFDGATIGGADPITGIGVLDDKLITFKGSYIFMTQGQFPNELGQQYGLSQPLLISADTGCINHKSIQNIPQGILFQSRKGWYVLTRGLTLEFAGEGAEGFSEAVITSGNVVSGNNQVRYTTLTGPILAYDFLLGKWFEMSSNGQRGSALWGGGHVFLENSSLPTVTYEGAGFFDYDANTDTQVTQSLKVETSWIKTTGIQDFGRVRNALILGKYKSPHTLTIQVYYDYETTAAETHTYTHDPLDAVYQCRVHLERQKCQAIKFIIFDNPTTGSGEGVELTNLTLELGVRKGTYKLNPSKTV